MVYATRDIRVQERVSVGLQEVNRWAYSDILITSKNKHIKTKVTVLPGMS